MTPQTRNKIGHTESKGVLGPKQLAWLGKNVPHFRQAKKDADRVIAESEHSRALHPMAEYERRESECK